MMFLLSSVPSFKFIYHLTSLTHLLSNLSQSAAPSRLSPSPRHTCYVLHTGDGHDAVFVNAVAAPGQLLALFVPSSTFVHVHEVGAPLLRDSGGRLHTLLLSHTHTHNYVTMCFNSFSDVCRPDKRRWECCPELLCTIFFFQSAAVNLYFTEIPLCSVTHNQSYNTNTVYTQASRPEEQILTWKQDVVVLNKKDVIIRDEWVSSIISVQCLQDLLFRH